MPNTRLVVGTVAGAALGVALTPVAAPAIVGFFGFSTLGPTGLAAVIQAGIGNVAAGSAFAVAQSIGMGGAIPTVISAVGAGVGAGIGAGFAGGEGSDDEGPTDEDTTGEDAAGGDDGGENATGEDAGEGAGGEACEDGTTGDAGEGPAGEGVPRTGPNRCRECQRRRERVCRHR